MSFTQEQESHYVDRGLSPIQPDPIQKLKLEGNIVLGDFIFNTIDEYGVVWVVSDIAGWWQQPEPEMPDIPRGFGDGSYEVDGRYLARTLTIEGSFLTPDPALVELSRDKLVAATDLVYKGAWLKTGTNPIRASFVRLAGQVSFSTENVRGRTNFTIELRAADPIKYAWNDQEPDGYEIVEVPARNISQGYTGEVEVVNVGNYSVPCYLEVVGDLVSPATIFNRTTNQLIILTQGLKGSSSASVINKQLTFDTEQLKDVATLTTTQQHGFREGNIISVSNVGVEFDGERLITSTPTSTTFTFDADAAEVQEVAFKTLQSGVATLQTVEAHGLTAGEQVTVAGVDSVFDGNYTVASAPTATTFTYSKTRVPPRTVVSTSLVANIATLTTSEAHNFILGESITVSGVDINYDGTYEIIDIPSETQFSYAATRTNARSIVNKTMSNGIVTLTTSAPHGFVVDEGVNISGVDISLNGGYFVDAVTSTTFSYRRVRATEKPVSVRARSADVATITTPTPHSFVVGERVTVEGVGSGFDGTHTITTLPSNTTFTYANVGQTLVSASVPSATVHSQSRIIKSYQVTGNVVTITTNNTHGAILGEQVTITGTADVDGTYRVTDIPSGNTLQFNKTMANVAVTEPTGAFLEMSGTINAVAVSPAGTATVAGSLPSASASGLAGAPENISRTEAFGSAIKKNDVIFTPGISGSALLSPEILEIDTRNREVAFNGEVVGARGRIDVLADFIQLAPGSNVIEFQDEGAPEGEANLRIFYRSGWLA